MLSNQTNSEGFLLDWQQWSQQLAIELGQVDGLVLTAQHLAILEVLREFYQTYQLHPSMRILIKLLQQKIGAPDLVIDSIYVHLRFPEGLRQLSRLAGLPKPLNCI